MTYSAICDTVARQISAKLSLCRSAAERERTIRRACEAAAVGLSLAWQKHPQDMYKLLRDKVVAQQEVQS